MVQTIKGETATLLFCERRSSLEMLGWELEKKLLSCLNRQFRRETGERLVVALHVVDSNLLLDCRRQTQPPFWPLVWRRSDRLPHSSTGKRPATGRSGDACWRSSLPHPQTMLLHGCDGGLRFVLNSFLLALRLQTVVSVRFDEIESSALCSLFFQNGNGLLLNVIEAKRTRVFLRQPLILSV